ncbi:MAG: helicase associated domain-containing protein [Candidatus Kapabacteria bacterium]|nr:helicase associated domain-containing protein [Candidatus Kapabacteria bacterium]
MKRIKKIRETKAEQWEKMWCEKFEQLKKHKELFGTLKIRRLYEPPYQHFKYLRTWCNRQRNNYKDNSLHSHRYILLSDLGFSFDPFGELWEKGYKMLLENFKEFGTCKIKKEHKNFNAYKSWALYQRTNKDKLSKYQIDKLNKIGFEWRSWDEIWEDNYQKLLNFKNKYGTSNISLKDYLSNDDIKEIRKINSWTKGQRRDFHENQLTEYRANKLMELDFDFVFDVHQSNWEKRFKELIKYKNEHGNCMVPLKYNKNKKLAIWVFKQRNKKNILSESRINKLNRIGFVWKTYDENWEQQLSRLIEFKKKNGHCRVIGTMDASLAHWVHRIRDLRKNNENSLSTEQIQILDNLGFIWDPLEYSWQQHYKALVKFRNEFGHTRIPHRKASYKKLLNWTKHQRDIKDKLPPDKFKKLDDLGFNWNPLDDNWMRHYNELVEFKKEFGHLRVPYSNTKNIKLFNWIYYIRSIKEKLDPDKIKKLDDLGFY